MEQTIAVFDVDNTLTVRDCVVPFVTHVAGVPAVASAVFRKFPTVTKSVIRRDRDALKLLFVKELFAGKDVDQVDDAGVQFAARIANEWMREDTCDRLRWHQEQGHVVVLVSASLSPYLVPLGDLMEVDAVLCATLESENGKYTGNLVGANCRGVEKVNRISEWCREAGLSVENVRYAYGDSSGDAPMLAMAEHAEWVGSSELAKVPQ